MQLSPALFKFWMSGQLPSGSLLPENRSRTTACTSVAAIKIFKKITGQLQLRMMASSSSESPFQVGQRIRSSDADGFKGTVRYIGPVTGQQGSWIGIEWDDLERGKHDGEAGGVKYFDVEQPGAGSLVRSHKIKAGVTLVQALKARYKPSEEVERVEGQLF